MRLVPRTLSLVVDVRQEAAELEVVVEALGGSRKYCAGTTCVWTYSLQVLEFEEADGHAAEPVARLATVSEGGDAVVGGAEGDEGVDEGVVAALDVGAEEEAALGEADGVEAVAEFFDLGELVAYRLDLVVESLPKKKEAVRSCPASAEREMKWTNASG